MSNTNHNNQKQLSLRLGQINKLCGSYQQNKAQMRVSQEKIDKAIKDNTQEERRRVEEAIENLNKKVDRILQTPQIKNEKEKFEQSSKMMYISLQKAMESFHQCKKMILDRQDIPNNKKQECIRVMYQKLMNKLISKEEMNQFQSMFGNVIFVGPSSNMNRLRLE